MGLAKVKVKGKVLSQRLQNTQLCSGARGVNINTNPAID